MLFKSDSHAQRSEIDFGASFYWTKRWRSHTRLRSCYEVSCNNFFLSPSVMLIIFVKIQVQFDNGSLDGNSWDTPDSI